MQHPRLSPLLGRAMAMARSPCSVLGRGKRRQLWNSHLEPTPRQRENVGELFSTDGVEMVCGAGSPPSPVPVAAGHVLELCWKSAVLRVTASCETTHWRESSLTHRTFCSTSGWRKSAVLPLGCGAPEESRDWAGNELKLLTLIFHLEQCQERPTFLKCCEKGGAEPVGLWKKPLQEWQLGQRGAEHKKQLVPTVKSWGSWGSVLLNPNCEFLKAEILTWNRVLILRSLKVVWQLLSLLVAGLVCVQFAKSCESRPLRCLLNILLQKNVFLLVFGAS